jgi:hypothetical protein
LSERARNRAVEELKTLRNELIDRRRDEACLLM